MKPWLLMMLTTLLVGCGGTPQPKVSFYLLPNNPELSEHIQPKTIAFAGGSTRGIGGLSRYARDCLSSVGNASDPSQTKPVGTAA